MGVVTQRGAVDVAQGQCEVVQFLGGEDAALEGLGQDTSGAGRYDRILENLRTDLQLGFRHLDLGCRAELAVLVRGPTIFADRQQTGATAIGGRV
ncbi:hypothetical protein D3C80_1850640 [compost metagenome]